jgi:hypothetical protein
MGKIKCKICDKKLNRLMVDLYTCRCGGIFCREKHMMDHDCPYDYHKDTQKKLEKDMPPIIADKIIKI